MGEIRIGMGCNKPIAPPSKVVCRDCLDAMGDELAAMLARMEAHGNPNR